MSGLGHYLEDEGLPTTAIALVREHAQVMHPPRALWVPFPLGRPFGASGDAAFQTRVLRAVLGLLERGHGPVLEDYPEDAPADRRPDLEGWACPVSFAPRTPADPSDLAGLVDEEIRILAPWYELGRERRGRTTVGLCGLPMRDAARFLCRWLSDPAAPSPLPGAPIVEAARWCGEDLKAFYLEAATARPGGASWSELECWLWTETSLARLLKDLSRRARASDDAVMRDLGSFMLVPGHWQD